MLIACSAMAQSVLRAGGLLLIAESPSSSASDRGTTVSKFISRCHHGRRFKCALKSQRQLQQQSLTLVAFILPGGRFRHGHPHQQDWWVPAPRLGVDCQRKSDAFGVVAAAAARNTGGDHSEDELPPASREEALLQAGASLRSLLDKPLRDHGPATVKQRRARRQVRLRVDIPLSDDSSQALYSLAFDLTNAFRDAKTIKGTVAVYVPESLLPLLPGAGAAAAEGNEQLVSFLCLDSQEGFPADAVVAIVIAPSFGQTSALEFVTRAARARPVVVVNPEWTEEDEQSRSWGAFLTSFSVAYSFIPLSVKGFFSTTEGAVLKHVKSGAPEGRPWLIFVKEGGEYKSISSLKTRPTPADLENALYSSMAMNSPVNKSIMFIRGLIGK